VPPQSQPIRVQAILEGTRRCPRPETPSFDVNDAKEFPNSTSKFLKQ
jgi:hypothetical protein